MVIVRNMKADIFEKKIENEPVICICAGQGLRDLCETYPQIEGKIRYVVDNYTKDRIFRTNNREIPVLRMHEAQENSKDALVAVTSLQYAKEIIQQLDELENWNGQEILVPALFQTDGRNIELRSSSKQIIPKKIHYCWFGKGEIPEHFRRNIRSWGKNCPDYEIIRWDESNYDYKKINYMRESYEAGKWGFVPDFARLDIINTYGGIYLDTDIELIKPMDDFLQFELFCGFQDIWFVNFGLGFGGVPNHPILSEMMKLYAEMEFVKKDGTLNLTASPVYQTKVLERHGLIRNGSSQKHTNFAAFSPEYFSPIDMYGFGAVTENTYSIHQYAGTWFGEAQKQNRERMNTSAAFVKERIR